MNRDLQAVLAEAERFVRTVDYELDKFTDGEGDIVDLRHYDETKSDFGEDALDLLRNIAATAKRVRAIA